MSRRSRPNWQNVTKHTKRWWQMSEVMTPITCITAMVTMDYGCYININSLQPGHQMFKKSTSLLMLCCLHCPTLNKVFLLLLFFLLLLLSLHSRHWWLSADCSNSIANALELLQSCTKQSTCSKSQFQDCRLRVVPIQYKVNFLQNPHNTLHKLSSKVRYNAVPL